MHPSLSHSVVALLHSALTSIRSARGAVRSANERTPDSPSSHPTTSRTHAILQPSRLLFFFERTLSSHQEPSSQSILERTRDIHSSIFAFIPLAHIRINAVLIIAYMRQACPFLDTLTTSLASSLRPLLACSE